MSLEHLRQSLVPVLLSVLVSLPLGWVAWRWRVLRGPIVATTGLMYTIPSLALLMIVPGIVGIAPFDESNLVISLTVYATALLVRSVVDGLDSVSPDTRLAATALGYSTARRLRAVELPLAGPVILAGLRVVAASTIALATVGILVGVTNLGYLFTNGLERRIVPEVLTGVLTVVLIAALIDLLLVLAGRRLMPWAHLDRRTTATEARNGA
nr:ABC transporter permease subunit [Pseudactinotalea sp. HY160]